MSTPFDLNGKVAIVTGANTGLGQGMAVALAEAGADVALVGRSAPAETVELVKKAGRKAHVIMADLGSLEPIDKIVSETKEALGGVDADAAAVAPQDAHVASGLVGDHQVLMAIVVKIAHRYGACGAGYRGICVRGE